jgi:hypothetical protein
MITVLEIILVFSTISWVGIILMSFNRDIQYIDSGEKVALILIILTIIGFILMWFTNF